MRIDLHTHSARSDGTLSPDRLVRHAAEVGVSVLGLTDHDCFDGWDEAAATAEDVGVTLVRGIEISCRYADQSVHLLGYLPDPTYPPLVDELQRILDGRSSRVPAILARLRDFGVAIDIDDVRRVSKDTAASGRPHVADALVERGVVADRNEAFDRFLGQGGPAYVDRYGADLATMVDLVDRAGGVTVLAHPWSRGHDRDTLSVDVLKELKNQGLAGLEVDHQDHGAEVRAELRAVARDLDLVVTGSSDFHGAGKVDHDLGCNTTSPDQLERLLDLAAAAAQRASRQTPAVVRP